jgi:hypothetical protein
MENPNELDSHDHAGFHEAEPDVRNALAMSHALGEERWVKLTHCFCWIERNPIPVALLVGASWACGELCAYFGSCVLLGSLAWMYRQANGIRAEQPHSQRSPR